MQKILSVFVIVLFSMTLTLNVFAGQTTLEVDGLTDEQKAKLVIEAERLKKEADGKTTVEKVNEWVELGKNVGVALTATAAQLGIAADQFLATNAGKITLGIIIWKVGGKDFLSFITGMGLLLTMLPMWIYFYRRMCLIKVKKIEYPAEKNPFRKIKTYEHYETDDDSVNITRLVMLVVLIAIVWTGLAVAL